MPRKPKIDRRFDLKSLMGAVTMFAVSFGLIRVGLSGVGDGLHMAAFAVGGLFFGALTGAVVGLAIGGRGAIISGALVGMMLVIFGFYLFDLLLPRVQS